MILKQVFKTMEGARKRAAFENAHCEKRYRYTIVRMIHGLPDLFMYSVKDDKKYTWQLERTNR